VSDELDDKPIGDFYLDEAHRERLRQSSSPEWDEWRRKVQEAVANGSPSPPRPQPKKTP
jgi:hypothetical protein